VEVVNVERPEWKYSLGKIKVTISGNGRASCGVFHAGHTHGDCKAKKDARMLGKQPDQNQSKGFLRLVC
jgi:hypothetical protein